MRLYDTLSGRERPFTPRDGHVAMYVCGITPYDTTHLGHAFTYVVFDTLARHLRRRGWRVTYVQNVTDVDDDILKRAREVGEPWLELGQRETYHYEQEMAALNVRPPDVFTRATENLPQMHDVIRRLEAEGRTYQRDGNLYYRVATFPHFGELSRLEREEMRRIAAERGGKPDDPRKESPFDFILWQAAQPGEPTWPSPWGEGRPGWHIECSAMAMRFLGPVVDVHGGGADLTFPHHECEIAQSEAATGERPFVRYWMHTAMLRYEGEKMSKSLGNLVLVHDLLADHHPDAIRLTLLRHRYRETWDYDERELSEADRLAAGLSRRAEGASETGAADAELRDQFQTAMDADLDTPAAIRALLAAGDAGAATLRELAGCLGLTLTAHRGPGSWPLPPPRPPRPPRTR